MDALQGVVQTFSDQEKQEAKRIQDQIETVAGSIKDHKSQLEKNFVQLSKLIDEVRSKKYWLLGNYKTFGDYLEDCEKKYGIKHSQLYVGMKVARNLLPSVPEKDLVSMGISKAGVLSKYVEQSGNKWIPDDILNLAKDPSSKTEDLDNVVNCKLHNIMPEEKGKWFSIGGFYADADEMQEIQDALEKARGIDPVVPNNIPEWQQTKEAVLRLAREFLGSW